MDLRVFLDTMIYLHHKPVEQLALPEFLGTEVVRIVVPRITLRELDRHKDAHSSQKIRNRARRILRDIEKWTSDEDDIRAGVSMELSMDVPVDSCRELGLNVHWNDDLLLASVLRHQQQQSNRRVVLVTQDLSLKLAARQLGVEAVELPDSTRLPDKPDAVELENRELRRAVTALQNAMPRLVVGICRDGTQVTHAMFNVAEPIQGGEQEIQTKLEAARARFPKLQMPSPPAVAGLPADVGINRLFGGLGSYTAPELAEYDRYNQEVDVYMRFYEAFLRQEAEWEAANRRTLRFQIGVWNTGTAPAEDVDVVLRFPNGFSLLTEDDLPDKPTKPSSPRRPRSIVEMSRETLRVSSSFEALSPHLRYPIRPVVPSEPTFSLKRTNSYEVREHFGRVKHGENGLLPMLFLTFDTDDAVASFACEYQLTVANLPDRIAGQVHFVMDRLPDVGVPGGATTAE
jgi:rRNA-processing protein FCF1